MPKLARTAVNTPAKKVVWPRFLSVSFQLKVSRTPHQKRTMSCTTVVTLGWVSFFFRVLGRGLGEVMTLTFLLSFTLPKRFQLYFLATIPQPLVGPSGVQRAVSMLLLYFKWLPLVEI
jgi:hypothetical protein